jgi:hypothetical protein
MAKTEKQVEILWCLSLRVDHKDGVVVRKKLHPVHRTGKNFIPVPINFDDPTYPRKDGYESMRHRVPLGELMKVKGSAFYDTTKTIRMEIYFLDTGFGEAKKLIAQAMEAKILSMKEEMDKLHNFWINRNNK